jgi:hypothetical protein
MRQTTVPKRLNDNIIALVPLCYCVGHKADIPNYRDHVVAPYVRFHSRHNRLKGDRRQQRRIYGAESGHRIWRIGMLSRALRLATVMLLIGCFAAGSAQAQAQNLEAGKSPSQIFAGTCSACHKSPRGLLKTVPAGSLPGFLRQHYTTSSDMASLLSSFLISNGATDTRYVGTQAKQGKDAKPEAKPEAKPAESAEHLDRFGRRQRPAPPPQEAAKPDDEPQEAAKPDADARGEPGRHGRNAKRLARPGEAPDAAKPAADGQAANERAPDGRRSAAKQRLSKRGKPGSEESSKTDAKTDAAKGETESDKTDAAKTDAAKTDTAKTDTAKEEPPSETAKVEGSKPEGSRPPAEGKSETAKPETAKIEAPRNEQPKETGKETGSREAPAARADPVPPVTPAPPPAPTAVSSGTPEPSTGPSAAPPAPAPPAAAHPAMTASVPPPAPIAPTGPPAPPMSQ